MLMISYEAISKPRHKTPTSLADLKTSSKMKLSRWLKRIREDSILSGILSGFIVLALTPMLTFIYSIIKGIDFISLLSSVVTKQLPIWMYVAATLTGVLVYKILRRSKNIAPQLKTAEEVSRLNLAPPPLIATRPNSPGAKRVSLIFTTTLNDSKYWEGYGQKNIDSASNKLVGIAGKGDFTVKDGIITVTRSNVEGRYILSLKYYYYQGGEKTCLPANIYGKSRRDIGITYNARVFKGSVKIITVFKQNGSHDWINNNEFDVTNSEWEKRVVGYAIPCHEDFVVEFHIHVLSSTAATTQIKDLTIAEIGN